MTKINQKVEQIHVEFDVFVSGITASREAFNKLLDKFLNDITEKGYIVPVAFIKGGETDGDGLSGDDPSCAG